MSILMGEFSKAEWQDEKQKSIEKIKRRRRWEKEETDRDESTGKGKE